MSNSMIVDPNWKVTDLKEKLRELGLPVSGFKTALIERLERYYGVKNDVDVKKVNTNGIENLAMNFIRLKVGSRQTWNSMTIPQLKDELKKYKLSTAGKRREEYVQRLQSYFECKLDGPINFDFVVDRPLEILMVAEKPSMAIELSKELANGAPVRRSQSSNGALIVLQFSMMFHGYSANVRMTSTLGHIYTDEFGGNVTNRSVEELFEADIIEIESDPQKKVPKMLAETAKGCDALVLWLDCDLEGESICFEVIDCVKNVLKKPPSDNIMDVIFRAKFSSADEANQAISKLMKPNYRQRLAAVAKHDLDLRIGVTFSRYQTFLLRKLIKDRDIDHLSFGPCQTPCLAFVVNQYERVHSHVSSFTCNIVIVLDVRGYKIEVTSDPIKDEKTANKLYENLKALQTCEVISIKRADHVKPPPAALNTVEMLKKASEHLGLGPKETMSNAEYLYTRNLITYPRTETTKYPSSFDVTQKKNELRRILPNIRRHEEPMDWEAVSRTEEVFERGEDKGEHPPIIPTGKPLPSFLTDEQKRLYALISCHCLASFMPEQRYHSETITFSAGGVTFKRKIQEIDDYGFTKLLPWEKAQINQDIPTGLFSNGSHVKIKDIKVSKKKSTPPTLLTESELIEKMEKHSIGTDASISTHIENIQRRKYVTVNKEKRTLEPTELGIQLIKAYRECVPTLAEATLRAEVESQLMKIASGEREFEDVRRFVLEAFKAQFKIFMNNFHKFAKNFETCFELKTDDYYSRSGGNSNRQQKDEPSSSQVVPNRKIIHPIRSFVDTNRNTASSVPERCPQPYRNSQIIQDAISTNQLPWEKLASNDHDIKRNYYDQTVPHPPKPSPVKRSLAYASYFDPTEDVKRSRH